MNIRSLLTAMAASFIFYSLMPLVTSASDHEGVMLEMKGNIMTELRRVGSPMLAVQLVDGANGKGVTMTTQTVYATCVVELRCVEDASFVYAGYNVCARSTNTHHDRWGLSRGDGVASPRFARIALDYRRSRGACVPDRAQQPVVLNVTIMAHATR